MKRSVNPFHASHFRHPSSFFSRCPGEFKLLATERWRCQEPAVERAHTNPASVQEGATMTHDLDVGGQKTAEHRGRHGWRARRQTEAFEDIADCVGRLDRRQNAHGAPAAGAFQGHREHSGQQMRPGQPPGVRFLASFATRRELAWYRGVRGAAVRRVEAVARTRAHRDDFVAPAGRRREEPEGCSSRLPGAMRPISRACPRAPQSATASGFTTLTLLYICPSERSSEYSTAAPDDSAACRTRASQKETR